MTSSSFHVNPFPGIRSYEIEEDDLFFGRELQVKELIDKLSQTRSLAIVGSSGCGKSSLIKAGLVPTLLKNKSDQLQGQWRLSVFKPGDDPIGNLAAALANGLHQSEPITDTLKSGPHGLTQVLRQQNNERLNLIIVDQFEELFRFKKTRAHNLAEAAHFVDLLIQTINQKEVPAYVVMSMRTDFLDDCTEYRDLSEIINRGYYLVPRMKSVERRMAITGPILYKGGAIEEDLVQRLLNEVGDDPDQLPILQHALMRTWDYWSLNRIGEQPISMVHYEAIGTMKEALSVHLEEIYSELRDQSGKFLAEKLFKALTDVGTDSRGTRRPTQLQEICTLADAKTTEMVRVIDSFRETGRAFLMPSLHVELEDATTVDISHESIMRVWVRLRKWVEEESQSAQLYLRLSKSAELYQEGKTGLWVNPELQLALQWKEQNKPNATWASRYDPAFDRAMTFLDYSKKQHDLEISRKENQQKRNLRRARNFAIILGAASVISILFLIISLNLRFKAEASSREALEKQKLAVSASKRTEEQRKEAILQKRISDQQQEIAEQQKLITEQQRQYAVKQQEIAQQQTKVAISERQKADEATGEAILARDEAQVQRQEAVTQKQIADNERVKAEESEKNTRRLRLLSVARTMAIQAVQLSGSVKEDLPALLALQAYRFNLQNDGRENDPDLYTAFSTLLNDQVVLRGHEDGVRAITLSKDGKTLISCSDDGNLLQWDLTRTDPVFIPLKLPKSVRENFRSVIITPDQQYLIAGTFTGKIYAWKKIDLQTLPVVIQAHSSVVTSLVCIPGKKQFASSGGDGDILLWDYEHLPFSKSLIVSAKVRINALAVYPDGINLVYGTADGKLIRSSLLSPGSKPLTIFASADEVLSVALSENGAYLAAGFTSGSVRLWKTDDFGGSVIELIGQHSSGVTALAFNAKGGYFASSGYDRAIKIGQVQPAEGKPVSIHKHDLWIYDLLFTPDNKHLISCSADKTIRIFSTDCSGMVEPLEKTVNRNMTQEEWSKYVGTDIPYEKTRPELP
jgi:ABC-type dipeptide/oligopeptide/nickel transport system ATPase component